MWGIPRGKLVYDGIYIYAFCTDEYKNDGIKGTFAVVGILSMLGSIPFYLAASKNKRRANAATVSINNQKISIALRYRSNIVN